MTVRRARPEDAGGIARVWIAAWRIAYRGLVPDTLLDGLSVEERRAHWRARLEAGDTTFVVAQHGIAGYCRVVAPDEVASVYVLPERRHGGLGSALLTAGLDELRARGADHATLWVFKANHAARAFYARFGFVPDGAEGLDEGTGLDEIRLRAAL
jgi:ribosomal protein S18 acetylase RimI-like enzyme